MTFERTPSSDEVLRRVGRNLVIFQQIESLLKFLLSNCKYKYVQHGDARSPLDKVEVGGNQKQAMLGQLVRKYLSDVLVDAGAEIKGHLE